MNDPAAHVAASPLEVREPGDSFPCMTLRCRLPAGDCVARQEKSDGETQDRNRGQGARYPLCRTRLCGDGRWIRTKLGPWLGEERKPLDGWRDQLWRPGEEEARRGLAARGLLDVVPSMDGRGSKR